MLTDKEGPVALTEEQIDNMKHTIGFAHDLVKRGKYVPYRNYFVDTATKATIEEWKILIACGYATVSPYDTEPVEVYYRITPAGKAYLGRILGVKIVEEIK